MPASGQTQVEFNDSFFESILRSSGVKSLCSQKADKVLQAAKASAPSTAEHTETACNCARYPERTETPSW